MLLLRHVPRDNRGPRKVNYHRLPRLGPGMCEKSGLLTGLAFRQSALGGWQRLRYSSLRVCYGTIT